MSLHTLLDAGFDVIGQNLKEASQALCGAIVEDPKQTLGAADLGDEREGGVTAAPLDFLHADRLDPGKITIAMPHKTACFTARNTLSQVVLKTTAVSFHDSRFAHRARNQR